MKRGDWKLILVWVLGWGTFVGGFVPVFVEIGKGNGLIGYLGYRRKDMEETSLKQ
jgi:hypothetical protein